MERIFLTFLLLVFHLSINAQITINTFDQLSRLSNVNFATNNKITYQYDEVGNRIGKSVTNNQSTDISNKIPHLGIKLYPNPTSESFCISGFEEYASLRLTDISGKMILSKQVSNNEIISISPLPKGIYIVELITKKGVFNKKLLKK